MVLTENTNPVSEREESTVQKQEPAFFTCRHLYLLAGIHDVPRWALVNTFIVVDNVTARLPGILAFVVQLLAEAEGHTSPPLKAVVTGWAGVHASAFQVEVAASHAFLGVVGLCAVPETLAVAALTIRGAALGLAGRWTNCEKRRGNEHRKPMMTMKAYKQRHFILLGLATCFSKRHP